jgi:hypothetical protein
VRGLVLGHREQLVTPPGLAPEVVQGALQAGERAAHVVAQRPDQRVLGAGDGLLPPSPQVGEEHAHEVRQEAGGPVA